MEEKLSRRKVLKSAGVASAGALVGTAGTASGSTDREFVEPDRHPVEKQYLAEEAIRKAIKTHANGLLVELADRDLLPNNSVDTLPLSKLDTATTRVQSTEESRKVAVTSVERDGTRTALIMVSEETPTHSLGIYVQPEADRRYALVTSKADGEEFAVNPDAEVTELSLTNGSDGGETSATTQSCEDYTYCDSKCRSSCGSSNLCDDRVYYYQVQVRCSQYPSRCRCYEDGKDCGGGDCYCSGCCSGCP